LKEFHRPNSWADKTCDANVDKFTTTVYYWLGHGRVIGAWRTCSKIPVTAAAPVSDPDKVIIPTMLLPDSTMTIGTLKAAAKMTK